MQRDLDFECGENLRANLGAHGMHIIDAAGVTFAPDDVAGARIGEFGRYREVPPADLDRAGERIAHAEQAPYLAHVPVLVAEAKRRTARNDEQPAQPREFRDQLVRQPLRDRRVCPGTADKAKRQHRDGWPRHRVGRLARYSLRCRCDVVAHNLYRRDEAKALAVKGPDELLALAVVAERLARRLDAAAQGGVADDAPVPDLFEDLVPGDEPFAVLDQEGEQGEHLRLQRARQAITAQLGFAGVEFEGVEAVHHGGQG